MALAVDWCLHLDGLPPSGWLPPALPCDATRPYRPLDQAVSILLPRTPTLCRTGASDTRVDPEDSEAILDFTKR